MPFISRSPVPGAIPAIRATATMAVFALTGLLSACSTAERREQQTAAAQAPASPLLKVITPEMRRSSEDEARVLNRPPKVASGASGRRSAAAARTAGAASPSGQTGPQAQASTTPATVPPAVAAPTAAPAAASPSTAANAPRNTMPPAVAANAGRSAAEVPAAPSAAVAQAPPAGTIPAAPVLDHGALERSESGFGPLLGAMHGLSRRCSPSAGQGSVAQSTYRAAVRGQASAAGSDPAADVPGFDEAAERYAAATSVDCGYVRSQSTNWLRLADDLRTLSTQSAEQYRRGLVAEVRRATQHGSK